jgi:lipopolysaccharide transport system ATP-binding protein
MTVVRFERVSKWYPRYQSVVGGLKAALLRLPDTLRSLKRDRIVALDDVSFHIERGETLGLVGPNGSGKSTVLALIAGVLRPQTGSVEVRGRVCPLLELGAGFHPELTGRENIVLNGVLLGLTRREIWTKMHEIAAFSELADFLEQPIRTYSSGMLARLGFSVAVHLEPEILLVDEILAVGDLHFQAKCLRKIAEFRIRKVTIVLVSHSPEQVRQVCDRAIWLQAGRVEADGEPGFVLDKYARSLRAPAGTGARACHGGVGSPSTVES